jgi:hypothetical protein
MFWDRSFSTPKEEDYYGPHVKLLSSSTNIKFSMERLSYAESPGVQLVALEPSLPELKRKLSPWFILYVRDRYVFL